MCRDCPDGLSGVRNQLIDVMTERSLSNVDSSLREALAKLPNFDTLDAETLPQFRAALAGEPVEPGLIDEVRVERVDAIGDDGHHVPAYLYYPSNSQGAAPAILNIHGGGYVMGTAGREHAVSLRLASALGCAVLSVDYRLAPEAPFPSASDDCVAALEWLHREAVALGIDPARIAVRGVSAGGGLAVGLALRTRTRSELAIAFMLLAYPMLDDRSQPPAGTGQHVWTRTANAFGWQSYLARSSSPFSEIAVPARAEDLSGLPPIFIGVGDIDLFISENLEFAARLVSAGVETELHVYPGAYHGFNLVADSAWAKRFESDCLAAFVRAFELQNGSDDQ